VDTESGSYGGCVHDDHDQQHDVPSEASSLSVVDSNGSVGSDLSFLNHPHVNIVRCNVHPKKQQDGDQFGRQRKMYICHSIGTYMVKKPVA
jgi:hypothetical protein